MGRGRTVGDDLVIQAGEEDPEFGMGDGGSEGRLRQQLQLTEVVYEVVRPSSWQSLRCLGVIAM